MLSSSLNPQSMDVSPTQSINSPNVLKKKRKIVRKSTQQSFGTLEFNINHNFDTHQDVPIDELAFEDDQLSNLDKMSQTFQFKNVKKEAF